jgi:acyl-coenzyme A thioesterase PaaI-like protein
MTDEEIRALFEGEVLRLGKSVGFVEGRLMDEDGKLLVRATSSVMLVPAERVAG